MSRRKHSRGNLTRAEFKREHRRNRQNHAWAHMSEQDKRALYMTVASKLAAIRGALVASRPNPHNLAAMYQEKDALAERFGDEVAWQIIARARGLIESQMRLPRPLPPSKPFEQEQFNREATPREHAEAAMVIQERYIPPPPVDEFGTIPPAAFEALEGQIAADMNIIAPVATPTCVTADQLMADLIQTANDIGLDARPRKTNWLDEPWEPTLETLRTDCPQDGAENHQQAGDPHEAESRPEEDPDQG